MAITTNAITNSFKEDLLQGVQTFVAGGGDTFKLALYTISCIYWCRYNFLRSGYSRTSR
jgi:hypothetical protein